MKRNNPGGIMLMKSNNTEVRVILQTCDLKNTQPVNPGRRGLI